MKRKCAAILLVASMLSIFSSCSGEPPQMPEPSGILQIKKPDKPSISQNYYGCINYDYLVNGQIPYGENSFGTNDEISLELGKDVSKIIESCVKNKNTAGSNEQMVKELCNQYVNTDKREKDGAGLIISAVDMIQKCQNTEEYINAVGKLFQDYNVNTFFSFMVDPDAYDTSVYKLYIGNMNTCGNMKENFTRTDNGYNQLGDLVRDSLVALKAERSDATQRAKKAVKMVGDIMSEAMDSDNINDMSKIYHPYSKKDFAALFSNINTENLFRAFDYDVDEVILYDVGQAEKINEYLTDENLPVLKDYALTCLIFAYSNSMPPSMFKNIPSFADNGQSIEKKAASFINKTLVNEIGYLYGKEICTPAILEKADKMLEDIRESCRRLISDCDRLSDDSKKKFLDKLDKMIFLIGYDDKYVSPFDIKSEYSGGTLLQNVVSLNQTKVQEDKKKLFQKVDRKEWGMPPTMVNAMYNPSLNTVTLPAAMLSPASFDPSQGEYKNLGGLGHVIAHEMNHAFDSSGFHYDENGCYNEKWITEKDTEAYKALMDKAEKYYNDYKILDIYNINGKQTLSENLADLGGVQCILGVTDDREAQKEILEGMAEYCATLVMVEDVVTQIYIDIHSPDEARVNAVVSSMEPFYSVYDIKENEPMYVAPENRIKVW